jgi:hypothetical protein
MKKLQLPRASLPDGEGFKTAFLLLQFAMCRWDVFLLSVCG